MRSIFLIIGAFIFLGCAAVTEGTKGFLGVSTKQLEEARAQAIKKTFPCGYDTCYNKTKEILRKKGSYIYTEDRSKRMIAAYLSEDETTAAGLFFTSIDANNTQIEISSASQYGKEYIAKRVFSGLDDFLNPKKKEGLVDEKQEEETGSKPLHPDLP